MKNTILSVWADNYPRTSRPRLVANICLVVLASTLFSQCSQVESNTTTYSITKPYLYLNNFRNWYSSGDLHGKDANAWQGASYDNKLATSSDLVVTMWQRNMLNPDLSAKISNRKDTQVLAEELVRELDAVFANNTLNPETQLAFENRGVTEAAALVGVMNGWIR